MPNVSLLRVKTRAAKRLLDLHRMNVQQLASRDALNLPLATIRAVFSGAARKLGGVFPIREDGPQNRRGNSPPQT